VHQCGKQQPAQRVSTTLPSRPFPPPSPGCVPSHGSTADACRLTTEEMIPYVHHILAHPSDWCIQTMALLTQARLEKARSRTLQRSCEQLASLAELYEYVASRGLAQGPGRKFNHRACLRGSLSLSLSLSLCVCVDGGCLFGRESTAPALARLRYLCSTNLPPSWKLQRELGRIYNTLGIYRDALVRRGARVLGSGAGPFFYERTHPLCSAGHL
jgi:hypothetical protein